MAKRSAAREPGRAPASRKPAAARHGLAPRPSPGRDPARAAAELLVWALVVVPPLVVVPTAKEAFRLPKLLVAEWLALASLLPLCWLLGRRAAVAWREVWRLPALRAVAPALAVATLGLLTSPHGQHVRSALPDLWIGAACLVAWSAALPAPSLARPLRGLLVPASLLALLGVLQFHDFYRPFRFVEGIAGERLGVTSLAGNAGDLGAFLVLPCLVALAWIARARRPAERWTAAAALALCLYALAATQTLAALVGLAAGGLVYGGLALPRRRSLALAAGGALAAVLLVAAVPPLRARLYEKGRQVAAGDWNAVLTGRLDGWRAAVWMAERRPWTGVGHGAFVTEFVPAKLALLERGETFYAKQTQVMFGNAHNEALEAAATWGLPGLVAALWGIAVVAGAARRRGAPATEPGARAPAPHGDGGGAARHDRALAWAGLAALAALSLAHFPFHTALVGWPAVLFLAWVLARAHEAGSPALAGAAGGAAMGRGVPARLLAALLGLALLVALLGQTVRLRDRILAGRLLRRVEVLTIAAARSGRLSPQLVAANLEALRRAAALDPADAGILLARGGLYQLIERPEPALAAYHEALALEPRPEIYLNLGKAYALAGRQEEALRAFAITRRLDPLLADRGGA